MENIYLDVYTVGVGLEYYESNNDYLKSGDIVEITSNNSIMKDNKVYGYIGKQQKYYEDGNNILNTLIKDDIYQIHFDDFIFTRAEDINYYFKEDEGDIAIGDVIYADENIAIIYLGGIPFNEILHKDDYLSKHTVFEDEPECPCDFDELAINSAETILSALDELIENGQIVSNRKEEKNMKNMFEHLGFGKCYDNRFSLSINGIAVRQANTNKYVIYNKDKNEFVDATDTLLNIKEGLFVLPATEIKVGDTVLHEDKPYYIIDTRNEIKAVSYDDCTQTVLIPKTTMFGVKYFTKIFSLFGDNFSATGELLNNPMTLMMLMNDNGETDLSKLMLLSSIGKTDFTSNPMLMALMLKDNKDSDLSTLLMLSMMNGKDNPFTASKPKKDKE